jgi:hypothetical protein
MVKLATGLTMLIGILSIPLHGFIVLMEQRTGSGMGQIFLFWNYRPSVAPAYNSRIDGSLTATRNTIINTPITILLLELNLTRHQQVRLSPQNASPNDGFKLNLTGSSDAQVDKKKYIELMVKRQPRFGMKGLSTMQQVR